MFTSFDVWEVVNFFGKISALDHFLISIEAFSLFLGSHYDGSTMSVIWTRTMLNLNVRRSFLYLLIDPSSWSCETVTYTMAVTMSRNDIFCEISFSCHIIIVPAFFFSNAIFCLALAVTVIMALSMIYCNSCRSMLQLLMDKISWTCESVADIVSNYVPRNTHIFYLFNYINN